MSETELQEPRPSIDAAWRGGKRQGFHVPGRTFMTRLSRMRGLMLAGTLGTLLVVGWQAAAQQPLPPGSPLIGRPDTEGAKKLAPVAPPPVPTTAEKLPIDKLKAPKGFKIE